MFEPVEMVYVVDEVDEFRGVIRGRLLPRKEVDAPW